MNNRKLDRVRYELINNLDELCDTIDILEEIITTREAKIDDLEDIIKDLRSRLETPINER